MSSHLANQIHETAAALKSLACMPHPSLAIDLDGCIDEAPIFFNILSNCWKGKVFVVTYRSDRAKAVADLRRFSIKYNELILVDSFDAKARAIVENNILIYFDDQPEMVKYVPSTVAVMLVRNGGNFCFDDRLWLFSHETARLI